MRYNFNDSFGKVILIILKHSHYLLKGHMEMGIFTQNRTMKEYIKVSVQIIGTTTTNAKKVLLSNDEKGYFVLHN